MKQRYEELVKDFCGAVGLPDARQIMNSRPFQTDGVIFTLRYDEKNAPQHLLIYTDFGPMPGRKKKPIYYTLLEQNFIGAVGSSGTYSMNPVTRHIVHIEHIPLGLLNAGTLSGLLGRLADQACEWRITHYVGDVALKPPSARGSLQFRSNPTGKTES